MVAKCKAVGGRGKLKQAASAAVKCAATKQKSKLRLTGAGQHFASSGLCMATELTGKPCGSAVGAEGVPYCKKCMRFGDPSLKVVEHPLAGKILIAARKLPKSYRIALWGRQCRKKDMPDKGFEWAFEIGGNW